MVGKEEEAARFNPCHPFPRPERHGHQFDEPENNGLVVLLRTLPRFAGIARREMAVLLRRELPLLLRRAPSTLRRIAPEVLASERAAKASELLTSRRAVQVSEVLGAGDVLSLHKKALVVAVQLMTWGFIGADVYLTARKVWNERDTDTDTDDTDEEWTQRRAFRTAKVAVDKLAFHMLATIYVPAWILDGVYWAGQQAANRLRFAHTAPRLHFWAPLVLTAAAVPLIIDPVCDATNLVMDRTVRRIYFSNDELAS